MTTRHLLMAVGLIVAGWLAFFGDKTPTANIVEPVAHTSASTTSAAAPIDAHTMQSNASAPSYKTKQEVVILALQPRDVLIGGANSTQRTDRLFTNQTWAPPPPPPTKLLPPPPPTAPPLPFTYLGKKVEGSQWEVYLARGDQTFIVHEQTVIEGTYRADLIKPPTLSITYLPLKQVQTLIIGETD